MKNKLYIRKVKRDDIQEVFNLSNQDYVRKFSINKEKIKWKDHIDWFNNIIQDRKSIFYVITDDTDEFLGQIRYKIENNTATVSISLSNIITGQGFSKILLINSIEMLFSERNEVNKIIANVLEKNIASVRLFEGTGFHISEIREGLIKYVYFKKEVNK